MLSWAKLFMNLIVSEDFHHSLLGIPEITCVTCSDTWSWLNREPSTVQAEIADSSQGFGLTAGTEHKVESHCR